MPRRKTQSVGEILIGYFTVCSESDAQALLVTAKTIVAARFPPQAATVVKRKPRAPKLTMPAPNAPAPVVGAAQQAAAAQSPTRRQRPAVVPADAPMPIPPPPPPPINLPDQGLPGDQE